MAVSAACDGTIPRPGAMGPSPDAAPASPFVERDGSRLKARWLEGPGGQRTFRGFHDVELKSDCNFSSTLDGSLLCLPPANYLEDDHDWANPSCTQPVVWMERPGCQISPFVYRVDFSDRCRYRERLFRLGPAVADGRAYYQDTMRGCIARGEFPDYAPHYLGEELLAGSFVRATIVARPAPPGQPLQLLVLEAEDGAASLAGFMNPDGGYECGPSLRPDGGIFCAPYAPTVSLFNFADAACREPAVSTVPACGAPPTMVRLPSTVELTPGVCTSATTLHEVGPPAQPGYRGIFGTCEPILSSSRVAYHAVGPAFPPDRFVTFEQVTEPPRGLARRVLVAPGGAAITSGWFDHARKARCSPVPVAGKQRCVPDSGWLGDFFADESCTQPVLRATADECLPRFARWPRRGTCPPSEDLYAVGARHRGLLFEEYLPEGQTTRACRFALAIAPRDVFHDVTPLAPEEFPELKPIEPRP